MLNQHQFLIETFFYYINLYKPIKRCMYNCSISLTKIDHTKNLGKVLQPLHKYINTNICCNSNLLIWLLPSACRTCLEERETVKQWNFGKRNSKCKEVQLDTYDTYIFVPCAQQLHIILPVCSYVCICESSQVHGPLIFILLIF